MAGGGVDDGAVAADADAAAADDRAAAADVETAAADVIDIDDDDESDERHPAEPDIGSTTACRGPCCQ